MTATNAPSANMGIVTPVVLGEVGPYWASELNAALSTTIDAHDHTTGKGVRVPVAGLNINANLAMTGFAVTTSNYYGFTAITQPAGAKPVTVFASVQGGVTELFYEDDQGRDVQLTNNGTVGGTVNINKGFTGGYDSTAGTGTASAYYDSATARFVFYRTPSPTFNTSVRADVEAQTFTTHAVSATGNIFVTAGPSANPVTSTKGYKIYANTNNPGGGVANWDTTDGLYVGGGFEWHAGTVLHTVFTGINTNCYGATSPLAPLHTRYQNATTGAVQELARWEAHCSFVPNIGFGPSHTYYGTTTNDSAIGHIDASPTLMGQFGFTWLDNPGVHSGVSIYDANAGVLGALPVLNSDGAGHIGINAPGAVAALTVGGTVRHNGTGDLGTTGAYWANVYATNVTASATLTLTGQGAGTIALVTASDSVTCNSKFSPTRVTPTLSGISTVHGLYANNLCTAWGRIPNSGTSATAQFNVASIAWNPGGAGAHVCDVTLSVAASTNDAVVALIDDSGTVNFSVVQGAFTSSTVIRFVTFAGTSGSPASVVASNKAFRFACFGT